MAKEIKEEVGENARGPKPFDPRARNAIVSKYTAHHQADMEVDLETVPGAAQLQGGYDAEGDAATTDGDSAAPDSAVQPQRTVAEQPTPVLDSAPQGDPMVTLKVYGREIQEPQSVVDAAGGIEARQIALAAEQKLRQGSEHLLNAEENARKAEELNQRAADARRKFNEQLKAMNTSVAPSRPTEAPAAPATASTVRQPEGTPTRVPEDRQEQARKLVLELYSGDPDRAAVALADVLEQVRSQPTVDVNRLVALEQARSDKDWAEREAATARKAGIDAVNSLMRERYPEILSDPTLNRDCAHLYNAEVNDPKNRGRAWVVIADEVATRVLGRAGVGDVPPNVDVNHEVGKRTNFKRRIPAASSAADRVPEQEAQADYPVSPSDVVNMFRAARHQPTM